MIARAQESLLSQLASYEVSDVTQFRYVPYVALKVDKAGLQHLLASSLVSSIEEDVPESIDLADSVPLIGAPNAWQQGYSGAGMAVAILDTGVEATHSFLAGRVVAEACYSTTDASYEATSLCPNGATEQTGAGAGINCTIEDGCGHGTHVAGIAAGRGEEFSGVARDADIIAVQVFTRFDSDDYCGSGPCALSFTSDQVRALEHVYELRTEYDIAAVNMSLGGSSGYTTAAECDARNSSRKAIIDTLRAAGIATVVSSGNEARTDAMAAPGCISSAISVGNTTKSDQVAWSSNSASWLSLLAPGTSINSSDMNNTFRSRSGTSMAAPHVAGAWAVLKAKEPAASVSEILNILSGSGMRILDTRNGITKSRIQVDAALGFTPAPTATPTATPTPTLTPVTPFPTSTPTATPTPTATTAPPCSDPFEPNDTLQTAIEIEPGAIESYVCYADDEDYFKFWVDAGQMAVLTLTSLPADYDLELYSPDGEWVKASYEYGTDDEYLPFTADKAGYWSAGVVPWLDAHSASDSYLLTLSLYDRTMLPIVNSATGGELPGF